MAILEPAELLSVSAIARYLRVTPETVRDWITAGKLPAYRTGLSGQYRVQPADLAAFLNLRRK